MAAGIMPPDDSRLWQFMPRAIQQGESFIQDDTRDWFEDRDRTIVICRDYPDHPRWLTLGRAALRARMHNAHITSEIHMLARISAGLPEYPSWVPARMSVKQQQADVAFRLTKVTRDIFISHGRDALKVFAERAPGQFIKFVGATFVPKKVEVDVPPSADGLDPETADRMLAALTEEMNRRAEEAKILNTTETLHFEPVGDVRKGLADQIDTFTSAAITHKSQTIGTARLMNDTRMVYGLKEVVDLEADVPAEVTEWD